MVRFSTNLLIFVCLVIFLISIEAKFRRPICDCTKPKDRGTTCKENKPKVQYYWNGNKSECLAFKYNGCGGNHNRFNSIQDCWAGCARRKDQGRCAGGMAKTWNGSNIYCNEYIRKDNGAHELKVDESKCPDGFLCYKSGYAGFCCNSTAEEISMSNYNPKCPPENISALLNPHAGRVFPLLGDSCEDDFCPKNSVCKKMEIFAHCCPK